MFVLLEATVILDRINQPLVPLELSTLIRVLSLKQIVKHARLAITALDITLSRRVTGSLLKQVSVCLVITVMEEQPLLTNISPQKVTTR